MSCKTWLTQLVPEASRKRSCRDVAASLATSATRMSGPSVLVNERTSAQRGAPVGNAE